jgi:hypothetical protein
VSSVSLQSGLGTISFDGQVVELFGFAEEGSRRFHVGQIQGISLDDSPLGSMFVIDEGPGGMGAKMVMKLTDADRAGLEALIQEVKEAR